MTRRNLYYYHKQDDATLKMVQPLYDLAERNGFTIVTKPEEANVIVSIGGDGSFLQAVRKTGFRTDCLYAGIAISGALSFYCDFHINDIDKMVRAAQTDNIEVRRYPVVEVTIDNGTSFYCLNEFSIRSAIIKTFAMDVSIDDLHFETFRGDGMIVSTPTGSTAYNKSGSGAVVDPLLPCLQVTELASLNNNRYRTLGSSFILSGERTLSLNVHQDGNDHPTMAMDNEALSIRNVKTVDINLSEKRIKTVKLKDNSFWEKVKRTFL